MSDLPPPSSPTPDNLPPPPSPPPAAASTPAPEPAPAPSSAPSDAGTEDPPQPKDSSEQTLGMVMHLLQLSALVLFKIPFAGLLAPLIFWFIKRDQSPYLNEVGKEVINFQINLGVACFVGFLMCFFPGLIVGIAGLVMVVIAAVKTNQGQFYRYPWIYRVLK